MIDSSFKNYDVAQKKNIFKAKIFEDKMILGFSFLLKITNANSSFQCLDFFSVSLKRIQSEQVEI